MGGGAYAHAQLAQVIWSSAYLKIVNLLELLSYGKDIYWPVRGGKSADCLEYLSVGLVVETLRGENIHYLRYGVGLQKQRAKHCLLNFSCLWRFLPRLQSNHLQIGILGCSGGFFLSGIVSHGGPGCV